MMAISPADKTRCTRFSGQQSNFHGARLLLRRIVCGRKMYVSSNILTIYHTSNQCPGASSFNVTINDKPYDAININGSSGYCYNSKPYDYTFLQDRTRCLPDTSNPTYQWGFSTMLSGLFVFFHFGWVVTMYIVWQDAQLMSTLVKTGYQMTPLRAAFAMAKAAKRKTGMGEKQLVRANTKELKQELYGTRKSKGTKVEYGIFEASDEEHGEVENIVRRRIAVPKDTVELSEIPLSSGSSSKPTVPP
jgi:hypothetical protein